ncbi:hypothetical protein ANN_25738 [Periplaneta americana]|uniref:Uncharacterized protein n=1 Tax=Periplaneta americana TaxID=6978 RepID=A0ABQ8S4S0_PERAM|nr:hypothetical protein ANN_25738 [Periplaneta americana]
MFLSQSESPSFTTIKNNRIMHPPTPNYLLSRFQFLTTLRNRHQALLSIPHHRTSLSSSSYTVEILRLWNSLPNDVRDCRTLSQLKIKLENFVLVNVFRLVHQSRQRSWGSGRNFPTSRKKARIMTSSVNSIRVRLTVNCVQFKVCHGSLYAVTWLADEPREFNLPTLPQRRITYELEKLPSKYGVHSEEYVPIRTIFDSRLDDKSFSTE